MHGEGNKEAAETYNEKTREFIEEGRVEKVVDQAEPKTTAEKNEIERAEKKSAERAVETERKQSTD